MYDTFVDEALNLALRTCAERSHRGTLEVSASTDVRPRYAARGIRGDSMEGDAMDVDGDGDDEGEAAAGDDRSTNTTTLTPGSHTLSPTRQRQYSSGHANSYPTHSKLML
eukprot:1286257-Pyramimonas_sp.AAC.1